MTRCVVELEQLKDVQEVLISAMHDPIFGSFKELRVQEAIELLAGTIKKAEIVQPKGLLDVVGKWPPFEESLEIALLKNENERLKGGPVLTEEQEDVLKTLKFYNKEKDITTMGAISSCIDMYADMYETEALEDGNFIPALRKFLNEVAE